MVVLNTLAELDQFKDGLSSLGVVRAIKEHSSLLPIILLFSKQDAANIWYTMHVIAIVMSLTAL